ncbi:MAG: epoxide hydrolase [Alphaproteobacteria bacterium PA2]|nr:MAG: epoxide hydrolase [Alphaproteobacteria bacterium PA2]
MISSRRITANGLSFALDEAGDGDTVALCLHGFPEARIAWADHLPALAGLGWRAVAPDMRGYGDTDRPADRSAYEAQHLIDDVAALFDALGAKRRILVGHDWGGVVAWQVALSGRVPLDGLIILNAPHPNVFDAVLKDGWRQKLKSWYVAFFQLPWLPEAQLKARKGHGLTDILAGQSANFSPAALETYRRNILKPGAATAMVNYYRANAVTLSNPRLPSEKLKTPTLLVWGDADFALDASLAEGNEAFVEDFTLARLPGISHWVLHDAPDAVTTAISGWARVKGLA